MIAEFARVRLIRAFLGLCVLAILTVAPERVSGSTSRLRALGGETELLVDDTNLFVYPGQIPRYSEVIAEPFDHWAGVLYRAGDRHTFGLMLHRPIAPAVELNDELTRRFEGENLGDLELEPWFDLLYGLRRGGTGLGVRASLAGDREEDVEEASASVAEIRAGVTKERPGGGMSDLAVSLTLKSFEDRAPGAEAQRGDGFEVGCGGRTLLPVSSSMNLIPTVRFSYGALNIQRDRNTFVDFSIGMGGNADLFPGGTLVGGVFFDVRSQETGPEGGARAKDRSISLPRVVAGAEYRIGGLFAVRMGFRQSAILRKEERPDESGNTVRASTFSTDFDLQTGLGLSFGGLSLDGVLERNFLRDGPHIIGGRRHGGGFFSSATLTYAF